MPNLTFKNLVELTNLEQVQNFLDSLKPVQNLGITLSSDSVLSLVTASDENEFSFYTLDLKIYEIQKIWNESAEELKANFFVYDLKTLSKSIKTPPNIFCIMLAGFIQNSSLDLSLQSQVELNIKGSTVTQIESGLESVDCKNEWFEIATLCFCFGKNYLATFPTKLLELWQNIESPVAVILGQMEQKGVYIDKLKLKQISEELQSGAAELQSEILNFLNTPNLNLNSPSQLGAILVERGFKLKTGASGKISTDRAILEGLELVDTTGVISKILEYRTLSKLFSTYTDSFLKLLNTESRIHGTYNQVQVPTGRISSNNPNLQNIPIRNPKYGPLIRSSFSAPAGRLILAADYSQMELRLLAHFSKDPVLIDAFKQNQDIHARTTAEIFEIPIDQVTKEQRRLGKTLNFALVYQQGPQATAKQLGIKTSEAKIYMEKYFARFARVKPFIEEVLAQGRGDGFVETLFGRRRYFNNLNSGNDFLRKNDERAAFNAVLQGSNADIIKLAMINLEKQLKQQNLDAFMILQVHDELVLEISEIESQRICDLLIQEMAVGQPLLVPILVEAGMGHNWSEAK